MTDDMLRADPRLRRQTLLALALAAILAVVAVFLFHDWLSGIAAIPGTDLLILRLRRLIGIGMTGSALCLAVLAWYSAHKAAKVKEFQPRPCGTLDGALAECRCRGADVAGLRHRPGQLAPAQPELSLVNRWRVRETCAP